MYTSSLNANNRLILNNDYNSLFKIIVTEPLDESKYTHIMDLFKKLDFDEHIDVKYLKGLFEFKRGNIEVAKKLFDEIYDIYNRDHGYLLNNESEFLYNYINIHKLFQTDIKK